MRKYLLFLEEVERLKRVPRSGWQYYGVASPESVADHSFLVAFFSYILASLLKEEGIEVDIEKILKMALFHELGETKLFDIQLEALRYLGERRVKEAEKKAVFEITKEIGKIGEEIRSIFDEFISRRSIEAEVVDVSDKLELLFQAYLYEKFGFSNAKAIFEEERTKEKVCSSDFFSSFLDAIKEMREENEKK